MIQAFDSRALLPDQLAEILIVSGGMAQDREKKQTESTKHIPAKHIFNTFR